MTREKTEREIYFQTIADFVLKQRQGHLFLTPHEMFLIDKWLQRQIPLRVVLEGLQRAEEFWRGKGKSRRTFTLVRVERFVLAAYQAFRERQLGRQRTGASSAEITLPRRRLLEAIRPFLAPKERRLKPLSNYFKQAAEALQREETDEILLEELDEKIDQALLKMALPEERQAVEVEVAAHFQAKSRQEAQALVERALIKHLRRKFQIPYCSPYLY
ncbi:hypothetical protein NLC35_02330 [Candidatus Aminicenantes bacterium AC-334-K16]|jgi:hypothetical protein|nr:hypothetical protein [Candidatus Aminicenantes bacterium AC-334-K16]